MSKRHRTHVRSAVGFALAALIFGAGCSDGAASVRALVWVNADRCLDPCAFAPTSALIGVDARARKVDNLPVFRVHSDVQRPLQEWLSAASLAGHRVEISSAYRSYAEQIETFMTTFEVGRAARPGHSEHQLGTAVDLRYDSSAAEAWLASTSAAYGFTQSYPKGKESVTRYPAEPWHYRYVGRVVAQELERQHLSLEELHQRYGALQRAGDCRACPSALSQSPPE